MNWGHTTNGQQSKIQRPFGYRAHPASLLATLCHVEGVPCISSEGGGVVYIVMSWGLGRWAF